MKWTKRIFSLLITAFVVGGLTFGASEVIGSDAFDVCGDDPGEIGTCPPFDQESCQDECEEQFMTTGGCFQGCCICQV